MDLQNVRGEKNRMLRLSIEFKMWRMGIEVLSSFFMGTWTLSDRTDSEDLDHGMESYALVWG